MLQWHKQIFGPNKWRCGRELWIYRQNPEKEILWAGLNSPIRPQIRNTRTRLTGVSWPKIHYSWTRIRLFWRPKIRNFPDKHKGSFRGPRRTNLECRRTIGDLGSSVSSVWHTQLCNHGSSFHRVSPILFASCQSESGSQNDNRLLSPKCRRGWKPYIYAQRKPVAKGPQGGWRFYAMARPCLHWSLLSMKVIVITHSHHPDRVGIRWMLPSLKVYYLPYPTIASSATLPNYFTFLPYFRTIILREHITLIHAHASLSSLGQEGILHAHLMGVRTVFTDHSLFGFEDAASILTNKLLEAALKNVDAVICVSHIGYI